MSSPRTVGLAVVAWLCAAPASGQALSLDTARLHHRADSLLVLWREANTLGEAQQAARDIRHHRAAEVTRATAHMRGERPVQAGDLMVIADAPDSIPLREAAVRAWNILSTTYASRATRLAGQPIRLVVLPERSANMANAQRVPRNVSVAGLERTLVGIVGQPPIDRRLSAWLGNTVQPVFDTGATRSNVYVQLVTAGSVAARRCFEGSLPACSTALQLGEDSDFFLTAFDAAERRQAVAASSSRSRVEPAQLSTFTHCVDDRVDSACVTFLRALGLNQIPQPLSFEARNLLVSTALGMGGAGAFDRLTADSAASVVDRLSLAARAPVDRVVTAWRSAVMAARPPKSRVPTRDALLAVAWVGLFAAGAIRSTRWRLT